MNHSGHADLYFNLIEISQRLELSIKKALKPYGITHGQYNILRILRGKKGEPISAKEIKNKMIVRNPDITRLIDRLVKKDLVIRQMDQINRRKVEISLSENGKKLLLEVDPIMSKATHFFFKDVISFNESNDASQVLLKINQFLKV